MSPISYAHKMDPRPVKKENAEEELTAAEQEAKEQEVKRTPVVITSHPLQEEIVRPLPATTIPVPPVKPVVINRRSRQKGA